MTDTHLTINLRWAMEQIEEVAYWGRLCLMTTMASGWEGDFFLNKRTALALQRRGLVTIDWGESQLGDIPEIYLKEVPDAS